MHRPRILGILKMMFQLSKGYSATPLTPRALACRRHEAWTYLSDSQVCWQLPMTPEAVDLDITRSCIDKRVKD